MPQPNILMIITDQQFADGLSCVMGQEHLHTPHMDALAAEGTRFTRAYAPNPLCLPMRTSMITGRYPHETGALTNNASHVRLGDHPSLGRIFRDAGYETGYFGKWHIAHDENDAEWHGFETIETRSERKPTLNPEPVAEFLRQPHDRPFLAVASFLTPHEICEWARLQDLPGGNLPEPNLEDCPPLSANHIPPENETDIMTHMRKAYQGHRLFPVGDNTDADWRRLMWGYYRLIERADGFVRHVMQALEDGGQADDTLVLFLSDHGDCHGAHRWNQKTVFYDESARVPFIMRYPGQIPVATHDVLLNTGTDIIPTLCDFADISVPDGLPGQSVKDAATGGNSGVPEYIVCENHMIQCVPVDGQDLQPHGRMVRSSQFKYCLYSEGERRDSLVDMEADPLEMVNLAGIAEHAETLSQHRAYLRQFAEQYQDQMAMQMLS